MDPQSTGPIEYAPAAPPPFRRRARRWVVAVVLIVAALAAYRWGPAAWFRARVSYWQARVAGHEAPPDTVVVRQQLRWEDRTLSPGASTQPTTIPATTASRTGVVPAAWVNFYGLVSPPGFQSRGTAFLHERQSPDGKRVLLAVDFMGHAPDLIAYNVGPPAQAMTPFVTLQFHVRRFTPGGLLNAPKQIEDRTESVYVQAQLLMPAAGELRLRAGQPDLADPTHFTIRYEAGGHAGVIDGWVRDFHTDLE